MTLENDINLAALGEQWHGVARGVDDFAFLSVGTGLGVGLVLRRRAPPGRNGAAGELDLAASGLGEDVDPCAAAVSALAARRSPPARRPTLAPPYDAPRDLRAPPAPATPLARQVVAEVARRIALHIVPIAAVADVGLVVLGGGIGANGDLLLDPIRELLERLAPVPAATSRCRASARPQC